jgi:hypothetical protein
VLQDAGEPLHYRTIAERAAARGLLTSSGRTPDQTMAAQLYTDISGRGDASPFVQVPRGVFGLRGRDQPVPPSAGRSGASAAPAPPPTSPPRVVPFVADPVARLCAELEEAERDSASPVRFEQALTRAFAFLGFDAEHLGGSGDTDVLLVVEVADRSLAYDRQVKLPLYAQTGVRAAWLLGLEFASRPRCWRSTASRGRAATGWSGRTGGGSGAAPRRCRGRSSPSPCCCRGGSGSRCRRWRSPREGNRRAGPSGARRGGGTSSAEASPAEAGARGDRPDSRAPGADGAAAGRRVAALLARWRHLLVRSERVHAPRARWDGPAAAARRLLRDREPGAAARRADPVMLGAAPALGGEAHRQRADAAYDVAVALA